jgi:hypothetical protein
VKRSQHISSDLLDSGTAHVSWCKVHNKPHLLTIAKCYDYCTLLPFHGLFGTLHNILRLELGFSKQMLLTNNLVIYTSKI